LCCERRTPWALGSPVAGRSSDLAAVLGEVDELAQACDVARIAILQEAIERGEIGSGPRALTATQWLLEHAPSLRAGGARAVVDLATGFGKPVNAPVRAAVEAGALPVRSAQVVISEFEAMAPLLAEGAATPVLVGLVEVAKTDGPRACRRLRPALLARYGLDDIVERDEEAAKRCASFSQPHDLGGGLFEYRLHLGVEGKEILEAALSPLAAPRPGPTEPDLRSSDRRRADALVEIVERGVASCEGVPVTAKAQLFVTIDFESLRSRLRLGPRAGVDHDQRAATREDAAADLAEPAALGGAVQPGVMRAGRTISAPGAGSLLAPETVRRLACDASIIPVVLGGPGEVLDWGSEKRLFTPAQTKRLWLRDGGCTFPACTMPPHWTQAHHLWHWADDGPTDLGNAALLCRHHHSTVHARRLAGRLVPDPVTGDRVEWDLTRGSYNTWLAGVAAREPA